MVKIFVDSGSSIKQEEKEKYGVEIIPLRYLLNDVEYQDGVDLSIDEFYKIFLKGKVFPKTSLPYLGKLESDVNETTSKGDDVIIITISSKISGTYNTISNLFASNPKVFVIDSLSAVGGIRLLVEEINRNLNLETKEIVQKVLDLIPKIRVCAIPETLEYLYKGGRLSKKDYILGSVLNIKPVVSIIDGNVKVYAKKIGLKSSMKFMANELAKNVDLNHSIVPSYTYNDENLKTLVGMADENLKAKMIEFDNLDPVLACHWGPNAFGYIFVGK